MESKLLQTQINPHFLYNTLDTIIWLIEVEKSKEAIDIVVALSEFFRIVVSKERILLRFGKRRYILRAIFRYSNRGIRIS